MNFDQSMLQNQEEQVTIIKPELQSKETTSFLRDTGLSLVKQIGKKIISGDFNLTTISFPIKVMIPFTILQTISQSFYQFPVYLNLASLTPDPLERFKFVVVATLAAFHKSCHFFKPLNPVLGETYEHVYGDGSRVKSNIDLDVFGTIFSSSTCYSLLYGRRK